MAVRVFIVDDHELFRTGLRALLEDNGVEVVGDEGSAERGLPRIAQLKPDVVLMDLSLPGMSGVQATRQLAPLGPEVHILILTISAAGQSVVDAVRAGASGYLRKDTPIAELVRGIDAAARGEASLSPDATAVVLDRLRGVRAGATPSGDPERTVDLTGRELDVLALLVDGKENLEIAQALSISPQTVKNHISNILAKLDVPNRTLAAVEAISRGLV